MNPATATASATASASASTAVSIVASSVAGVALSPSVIGTVVSFAKEFVKAYFPLLIALGSIVGLMLNIQMTPEERAELDRQQRVEVIKASKKFAHFTDDRKARKGDENDLYMLKTHGYDKFRFVSKKFLKQNGLWRKKEN